MSKKTWTIISLIFSVLALIYIILEYLGYCRYVMVHIRSTDHYINNYKHKKKLNDTRVVVSFSPINNDFNALRGFINSLLDQSVAVDEISMNIPYRDVKNVPSDIKKIVSVYGSSNDYGEATNIVPIMMRERDFDTIIILVDPTIIYGKDFIADILTESKENEGVIIHGSGDGVKNGMLLKPGFVNSDIVDYKSGNCIDWVKKCSTVDMKQVDITGNL